jgi:hypothetical protein
VNFSLKAKLLKFKSEAGQKRVFFCFTFLFVLFMIIGNTAFAQVETPIKSLPGKLPAKGDSIRHDTLHLSKKDTLRVKSDTLKNVKKKGAIETTIVYSAQDSINSRLDRKIVMLFGEAKIKYGTIQLEADEIVIDYETSTITAHGGVDSTGKSRGYPIFMNGSEKYETKDIVYNFKTKKAKISEVVTKQGEGFLHGKAVYKNEKNELFSLNNGYTTCDLAHPHFRIISTKAKAIPGDKMVSGPFYMEFNDVPTPIGFLFGIFPSQKKSSSGIIIPAYGEERNRGFFLRGGGYFFDISDYIKLEIKTDFYSKGSNALYINSNYKKRYAYNGLVNFTYTNNVTGAQIESKQKSKDFRLAWSHSPQTKGTGRFSASVNAATATYSVNNYIPGGIPTNSTTSTFNNSSAQLSSNISYSKTFAGTPFSLGINFRINENLTTKQVDVPFPDMNFNVNNLYPFKKVKNNMFLQNISTRLTMTATNQMTNNLGKIGADHTKDSIAPFNFQNLPRFFQNAKKGVRSSIPFQTSVKVLKYFTISPSINLDELWYFQKLNWGVDATGKTLVVKDTIQGFNAVTNYSGSVGLTTRIFGTKIFGKTHRIQAIRHVINPSIGLSFQPDFAGSSYDYYQRFDIVNNGTRQTVYKSRHDGFVYGSSRQGKSSALSFGFNNNIEMKVKNKKDTVAKKIPLFNTLSFSSGYNFAALTFKLAPVNVAANTNILNSKVNVNFSGVIDPYQYIIDSVTEKGQIYQTKRDGHYTLRNGFSSANFAFSTNLNPKGQNKDNQTRDKIAKSNASESEKKFFMDNPDAYVDFSIPWNLRFSYNANYTKTGHLASKITQAMRFSGDLSLSKKWKIDFSSGYDFQSKQITQSNIALRRDLHCWQMSLNWVPFGKFQNYSFSLGIKSSMLRDLKIDRTRSFQDIL